MLAIGKLSPGEAALVMQVAGGQWALLGVLAIIGSAVAQVTQDPPTCAQTYISNGNQTYADIADIFFPAARSQQTIWNYM